ncbi:MAG: STAS/SEC14 domain-containing protein [Erythrobacter sp.]|jgi:hypothetical protein|nr:STAS/SEC14 domain-containing protein [Erythrobacter sp.]
MIAIERLSPRAHRITVMGAFHHADAAEAIAFVKRQREAGEGGNLLVDATSLAEFSFPALSEQLMHLPTLLRYIYSLDRIAILSDEEWLRSAARLESALLPGVEYQVYDDDEAEAALAWVLEESDEPHRDAFREFDAGKPGIAAFELTGRIDAAAAERALALIEQRLSAPDCSRLLVVVKHWHGFDAALLLKTDLYSRKLDLIDRLERYAIVGGPEWLGAMAETFGKVIKPRIKAFDLDELDEALGWLAPPA